LDSLTVHMHDINIALATCTEILDSLTVLMHDIVGYLFNVVKETIFSCLLASLLWTPCKMSSVCNVS